MSTPTDSTEIVAVCPQCGHEFKEDDSYEEATIGSLRTEIPHIYCTTCGDCIGCMKPRRTEDGRTSIKVDKPNFVEQDIQRIRQAKNGEIVPVSQEWLDAGAPLT